MNMKNQMRGQNNLINNALGEAIHAPNKVYQFYFVKFWPNQEPKSEFKIEKAEKLIQDLNHLELQITKTLDIQSNQIRELDLANIHLQLEETGPYSIHTAFEVREVELKSLQEVLDRLCFGNKSYETGAMEWGLLSVEKGKHHELDNHKLQYQMIHGCKSLAEEKRQMRDIRGNQRGGEDHHLCKTISLGEFDWRDNWEYYEKLKAMKGITDSDRDRYPREIKKLRLKVDKCVYNAALKGKSWNSLGIKRAIEEKIKIINFELDMLKKKRREIRAKLQSIAIKKNALTEVRDSLNKKLIDTSQRKKEACQSIINLRKQYGKENACYYQNRFHLNKAMALASKKDVEALQKLSHTEGENFMSHWNKNKAFRDNYRKRVSLSLKNRQLNSDGRMKFFGHEEPLVLLGTPANMESGSALMNTLYLIK
ncbi:proton pump-interactor 1-like [Humulus lupulus]|uniref:proton pump-interactor 1-like n=1 Tax=Humulus lupulus TaxID=3486 RepID=UPI002B40DDDD|nr:proton pump-interactor 1-like [Humulus lupulus]